MSRKRKEPLFDWQRGPRTQSVLLAELRDVAQAWWDWLPHGVQIALEDVMAAERETKTGPIFGRPLLGRDGNPLPFDPAARMDQRPIDRNP